MFNWGFSLKRLPFLVPLFGNSFLDNEFLPDISEFTLSPKSQPNPSISGKNKLHTRSIKDFGCGISQSTSQSQKDPNSKQTLDAVSAALALELGVVPDQDSSVISLVQAGKIKPHKLETTLGDCTRAVGIRRKIVMDEAITDTPSIEGLPYLHYDFKPVQGACCENVIGYIPLPVGVAGPILVNGEKIHIPMATTEGCLVASTHRGCKAITLSGGATAVVLRNRMTRGPVVRFPNLINCAEFMKFLEENGNVEELKRQFNSTTRFGRLESIHSTVAGRNVYLRFEAFTGDAMGMNMISKGCEKALAWLQTVFPTMQIIALSGNYCTDKKPAAMNWINGRGKHVAVEAVIKAKVVSKVLKTTVKDLVDVNIQKNLIGSAMAGSMGGFNAHAANIVAAVFLATGQDPAQVVESANCITIMEPVPTHNSAEPFDLRVSVSMPCIEVGTCGGGTFLAPQAAMLNLLNCKGPNRDNPGDNSIRLAKIVATGVLAGELSLLSALAAGHLVKSHMTHNRSKVDLSNSLKASAASVTSMSSLANSRPSSRPSSRPVSRPGSPTSTSNFNITHKTPSLRHLGSMGSISPTTSNGSGSVNNGNGNGSYPNTNGNGPAPNTGTSDASLHISLNTLAQNIPSSPSSIPNNASSNSPRLVSTRNFSAGSLNR